MGFMEWVAGFSLPDNEEECNLLRTAETDPKPVQWDSTNSKCQFYIPTDEARLGMSKCTAEQMFDMSNNTCSEKVVDTACGAGMYRPSEGAQCVVAPQSEFEQETLVAMGECGANVTTNGSHSWSNGSCSLNCNEDFSLNEDGDACVPLEEFSNRMRKFSDRDAMILVILVVLMYMYRKEIKKQFTHLK